MVVWLEEQKTKGGEVPDKINNSLGTNKRAMLVCNASNTIGLTYTVLCQSQSQVDCREKVLTGLKLSSTNIKLFKIGISKLRDKYGEIDLEYNFKIVSPSVDMYLSYCRWSFWEEKLTSPQALTTLQIKLI